MFRVKLAIVIFFFSQGIKSKAQGKDSSKIEIQLFANLGVSSGTQKVENNAIADHLLYFETTYLSGQFIGANIIVWDNWGVTFGIEHKLLPKYVDYEGNFRNDLERKFQSNFFIDARAPDHDFGGANVDYISSSVISIGLSYRAHIGKFQVYPGISISRQAHLLENYSNRFKERNSNRVIEYSILSNSFDGVEEDIRYTNLLNGSMKVAYPISNNLLFYLNTQYSYFELDLEYTETERDLISGLETKRTFNYDQKYHLWNIGVGIIFEFRTIY